jgi:hypothetical protein
MYNLGTANMSAVLFPGEIDTTALIKRNRNYGAGTVEAADEQLKEDLANRRQMKAQDQDHNLTPPERKVLGDIEQTRKTSSRHVDAAKSSRKKCRE